MELNVYIKILIVKNNVYFKWGHKKIYGQKWVKETLFPSGALPTWINSSRFNLVTLTKAEHDVAHIKLIELEKFWGVYHSPVISGIRLENDILNNQE